LAERHSADGFFCLSENGSRPGTWCKFDLRTVIVLESVEAVVADNNQKDLTR